jgi:fluoroquinolone transport system permease protein
MNASAVGRLSLRILLRDPFLRLMALLPFVVALVFRVGVPAADAALAGVIDPATFRLSDYYPVISAFLLQLPGLFAGGVTGFSILEDRDEGILSAMAVTPIGRAGYLASRLLFPALLAVVGALIVVPLAGLHRPEPIALLLAAAASAPLAPVSALLLATLATDKVEGLAVWKLVGFLFVGPLVQVLPSAAGAAGWPLASYWATRVYLSGAAGSGSAGSPAGGAAGQAVGFAALAILCAALYLLPVARRLRRL